MKEEQDDLTLVYMFGYKNGKDSMKAENERLRAALRDIERINDSPGRTHQAIDDAIVAAFAGEKTND